MTTPQRVALLVGFFILLLIIKLNCSWDDSGRPPLGQVTGRVMLNGKPWAGIIIAFYPEKGRMATSMVDDEGYYKIMHIQGVPGALLGRNSVHFAVPTSGYSGPPLPPQFAEASELEVDVVKGKNVYDFDLDSNAPPKSASAVGNQARPRGNAPGLRGKKKPSPDQQGPVE